MFGKSILENVVMGNRDICKEDVVKLCEIVNVN